MCVFDEGGHWEKQLGKKGKEEKEKRKSKKPAGVDLVVLQIWIWRKKSAMSLYRDSSGVSDVCRHFFTS